LSFTDAGGTQYDQHAIGHVLHFGTSKSLLFLICTITRRIIGRRMHFR
jgi:hypothetical protein